MKQYAEAGRVAERVLRNGSVSAIAHYAAAVSLLMGRGSPNEALTHLRRAEQDIPKIHLLTAGVLSDAGRRSDAAQELQVYLRSGANREVGLPDTTLEAWLAALRQ